MDDHRKEVTQECDYISWYTVEHEEMDTVPFYCVHTHMHSSNLDKGSIFIFLTGRMGQSHKL